MATVVGSFVTVRDDELMRRAVIMAWTPLIAANAVGDAKEWIHGRDRSVQIEGTFDSATVVLQGSNDGTNWYTLTDPQGNAISKTSAALEQISEATRYIRPSVSSAGGSTSLTVTVFAAGGGR